MPTPPRKPDQPFVRFREFDPVAHNAPEGQSDQAQDDHTIRMVASTSAPASFRDWEGNEWFEVLDHKPESVDTSAARAFLLNHNADLILGPIRSIEFDGSAAHVEAEILEGARLPSGVSAREAYRSGALRGVSISYVYSDKDVSYDQDTRTATVSKWRLLEVTATPIPRDTAGAMRSIPIGTTTMPDTPAATPASTPAASDEGVRAATIAMARDITQLAESHRLPASDFLHHRSVGEASTAMLAAIARRDAANGGTPGQPVRPHIQVGEEAAEKIAKRAAGAVLHLAGIRDSNPEMARWSDTNPNRGPGVNLKDMQENNTLRGMTMLDIFRATAEDLGMRSMSRHDIAAFALGKLDASRFRDAANVGTGFGPNFIFANIIKKAVAVGFTMNPRGIAYERLVSRNYVPDYKPFAIGGLGVGNLTQTAENVAFPEMDKAEAAYNSAVKMWGGTITLTQQALVSDDTGRFTEALRQTGMYAKKTIDKRVFQVLLRGTSTSDNTSTWTNNTTAGSIQYTTVDGAYGARKLLGGVRAGFRNKIGLDGNPLNNSGSFLVVSATSEQNARGIVGSVAPGQQTNQSSDLEVISTAWLEAASLTGYSTTSYYLVEDPNMATGLVLSTIAGIEEPITEQYDPGAVAALKWKVYLPFQVDLFTATKSDGTIIVPGVHQGTGT